MSRVPPCCAHRHTYGQIDRTRGAKKIETPGQPCRAFLSRRIGCGRIEVEFFRAAMPPGELLLGLLLPATFFLAAFLATFFFAAFLAGFFAAFLAFLLGHLASS